MKKFNSEKRFQIIAFCCFGFGFFVSIYLTVYFFPKEFVFSEILYFLFILIVCFVAAKYIISEMVFIFRFYGVKLKQLDEALIFCRDNKEYRIDMTKDVYSMWCMKGYLIIWLSAKDNNIILLKESLITVGGLSRFESYLREKTNFISSTKEKKKILQLFNINIFTPLKYMKLPDIE